MKQWILHELLPCIGGVILGVVLAIGLINLIKGIGTISYNSDREWQEINKQKEKPIQQLKQEVTYLNNANYSLQEQVADCSYREDMVELYLWQYGTGRITKEELAAKIEDIQPRSSLLSIKKHSLEWEDLERKQKISQDD